MKSRRRQKREIAQGGSVQRAIENGAIPADLDAQAPNNSYSPPEYYVDVEFTCRDCGAEETWTAEQQKWYFEVIKAPIYGRAVRCSACRKKIREQKELQRQQMEASQRRRNDDSG